MLDRNACLVIVRRDNGYPLLVYGEDQIERAEHMARVNHCNIIRCVPEKLDEKGNEIGLQ